MAQVVDLGISEPSTVSPPRHQRIGAILTRRGGSAHGVAPWHGFVGYPLKKTKHNGVFSQIHTWPQNKKYPLVEFHILFSCVEKQLNTVHDFQRFFHFLPSPKKRNTSTITSRRTILPDSGLTGLTGLCFPPTPEAFPHDASRGEGGERFLELETLSWGFHHGKFS